MKKMIALVLALVMFCSVSTLAGAVSSKTTGDMTDSTVETTSGISATLYAEPCEIADAELQNLIAAESIAKYFENAVDIDGAPVKLAEMLETDEASLNVDEFTGLFAVNFEEGCGDVTATLKFATPFEVDREVLAVIGLLEGSEINWHVFEGIGVDSEELGEGCIKVIVPQDIVLAVQNGTALIAIISK